MTDAQIIHLPPAAPGWYVDLTEGSGGLGSIYVHTDTGTWVRGGREIPAASVPANLRKLGVI